MIGDDGLLCALSERRGVELADGVIADGAGHVLEADAAVSMNLWALRATAVSALRQLGSTFIETHHDDDKAELGLPSSLAAKPPFLCGPLAGASMPSPFCPHLLGGR